VLPFDKVIELEKIDDWTFRSIVKAYSPAGGESGTYGGHVFAQAAWAAAQTVADGFLIHVSWTEVSKRPILLTRVQNITGWSILGGRPNEHYTYRVRKIRDGRIYLIRSVLSMYELQTYTDVAHLPLGLFPLARSPVTARCSRVHARSREKRARLLTSKFV
jgi:hypothetical protein